MTQKMREIVQMVLWLRIAIRKHGPVTGYLESMDILCNEFARLQRERGH